MNSTASKSQLDYHDQFQKYSFKLCFVSTVLYLFFEGSKQLNLDEKNLLMLSYSIPFGVTLHQPYRNIVFSHYIAKSSH